MRRGRLGAARLRAAVGSCALAVAGSLAVAQEQQPVAEEPSAQTEASPSSAKYPALPPLIVDAPKQTAKKQAKKKQKATQPASGSAAVSGGAEVIIVPDGVVLGGAAVSDTGTTVFDAKAVQMRTDGSGDANTFLRNLPNVQYQNDTSTNAGVNGQSLINTKPLELSINGARTYENNFIVNGVSTKTITGTVERSNDPLSDTTVTPNIDSIYGLHSQQLFVPVEFLDQATVIDSNASAEYGEFMGGAVIYDLMRPPTDRYRASVDYNRHTDKMTHFILATPDGLNPNERKTPTFEKDNLAVSLGAPITTDLSFIAQASQKTAEAVKQKDYTLYSGDITEDSENNFFRGAVSLKTGIGKFTLDSSLTDYHQYWEGYQYRDLNITTDNQSSATQIEYKADLREITLASAGLDAVKLESRAYYNSSEMTNLSPGDTVWNWVGVRRSRNSTTGVWSESFRTSVLSDWCRPVPIETLPNSGASANLTCREGGYADMLQGQKDLGLTAKMTGNILFGRFNVGGEVKSVEGHRARLEDYTLYGVSTIVPAGRTIICPAGDNACNSEQYASSRNINPAFNVKSTVNAIHAYSEVDQTLGWFNVRAGVRLDYEDYFENLNLAPRLAGTVTPISGFSVTGGYNRYYDGESLYYALRDQQPRAVPAYSRSLQSDGTLSDWKTNSSGAVYTYLDTGVETPYADEYTGTVRIRDPLAGGQIRLRYLERFSEKQYSSDACVGITNCKQLNNDGEKFYRSATAEYTKEWRKTNTPYLNAAAITANITWSEQTASAARNTYYDDIEDIDGNGTPDHPIWYKGHSYTRAGFEAVTGNLDIPIRVGATLSTNWFNNILLLDFSAGYNFGYEGVYDTDDPQDHLNNDGVLVEHDVFADKTFRAALKLDVSGQINVSENAAINFDVYNITDSTGNSAATYTNPWVIGRSYWVGSTVKF